MNNFDRINELQREIEKERRVIEHCQHVYGQPYSNPETVMEGYGSKLVAQGSDCWTDFEGYHEVQKPRWTRKCTKCGHEDHTRNKKPIVAGYEPDFENKDRRE
jgi:hypothetical protein